jgi:hypothetical protein
VIGKPGLPVVFVNEMNGPVAPLFVTFDPATALETTLTNGNLTATHATTNPNMGARGNVAASSGKYYFEITRSVQVSTDGLGLVTVAGTYGNVLAGLNCTVAFTGSGNLSSNNGASGKNIGILSAGTVIGIAVDLTARKAWFRKGAAGLWNGLAIGSEDPVAGLGGLVVAPTSSFLPVVAFGTGVGGAFILNSGGSAFVGAAPSGFNNWPAS